MKLGTTPRSPPNSRVKNLLFFQPSFLASHQKQDSAAAVSIPLTASSHFRAITDTGSAPQGPCGFESAQTTTADGTMDIEGNSCEPWLKLQITSEQNSGEENGKQNVGFCSGTKIIMSVIKPLK